MTARVYKKQEPTTYYLQEIHFQRKDTERLKVKGWRQTYHADTYQRKAGIATLISSRADFQVRKIIRDKEGHYIMIRWQILQYDLRILHVYASNNRDSKYN